MYRLENNFKTSAETLVVCPFMCTVLLHHCVLNHALCFRNYTPIKHPQIPIIDSSMCLRKSPHPNFHTATQLLLIDSNSRSCHDCTLWLPLVCKDTVVKREVTNTLFWNIMWHHIHLPALQSRRSRLYGWNWWKYSVKLNLKN